MGAGASHGFTDVPDTNVFHADIDWLADFGVTKGCNPPANTEFCPTDAVTRETMAAFLRRLSENQIVDAKTALTAEEADVADIAIAAQAAENAQTVDGYDSSELITVCAAQDGTVRTNITSNTALGTLEVDAPVDGNLLITAVADIEHDCGQPGSGIRGTTRLTFDGDVLVSSQETRDEFAFPYDMAYAGSATATAVVNATAGSHTITYDWQATTGAMWSANTSITATFTPFGDANLAPASGESARQNPTNP